MPISPYLKGLREQVGTTLLLLPAVAAVIHDDDGRVLVQGRADDTWSLPAGIIEPGETPAQAIVREVWEESGLQVVPDRILGVLGGEDFRVTYPNGDQVEYTVVLFHCRVAGGHLHPIDGESERLEYFATSEMPSLGLPYPMHLFSPDSDATTSFFQWSDEWSNED